MTKSTYAKLLVFMLFVSAAFQSNAACSWYRMNTAWTSTTSGGTITVGLNLSKHPCIKQSWSLSGGTAVKGSYATFNVTKNGVYKICMKLVDTCNKCDTSICKEIKVDGINSCKVDFTATITKDGVKFLPSFQCNGKAVYSWKFGNGTTSHNYDPFVKFAKGTYEVCLTAKCYYYNQNTLDSCESKICKKITIKDPPCELKGDFYFKIGDKGEVTLMGTSNQQGLWYSWTIDNIAKKGQNVKIILSPGLHKICLTIFNQKTNCKITICKTIEVPHPKTECKIDFIATMTRDGVKFKPVFKGCNGTASYFWKFGNGTSSSNVDPFVKFNKGTYEVCLYAKCRFFNKNTNKYDSCESKICKKIVVKDPPCELKGDFTFKIGDKGLVTFIGSGSEKNLLYYWTINNIAMKGHDIKITLKPGTYKVCLTIFSQRTKCKITICKTIIIKENTPSKCSLPKGWSQTHTNCSTFVFNGYTDANNNTANPCLKYAWDFGDKTYAAGKEVKHEYKSSGTYTVCMKVIDTCKKCDTLICKTVTVNCSNTKCVLPTGWSQSTTNCSTFVFDGYKVYDGNNNIITNPCHKYSWDFGDKTTASGKEVKHEYQSSGTYTVCMRVVDTCKKCDTMICKTVKVECGTKCTLEGGFRDSIVCNKVFLIPSSNSKCSTLTYRYTMMSNNSNTPVVKETKLPMFEVPKSGGAFKFCLYLTDNCTGCKDTICKYYTVKACCNNNMNAEFSDTLKPGGIVKFVNHSTNAVSFKWLFGDGTSSTDKNISHTYTNAGGYKVCLIAYDSSKNCTDTFCKYIQVSIKRSAGSSTLNIEGRDKWQLYPNPVSDEVTISGFEFIRGDIIHVKDMTGKTIYTMVIAENRYDVQLQLGNITPGIYTIECQTIDGQLINSKLIKQ